MRTHLSEFLEPPILHDGDGFVPDTAPRKPMQASPENDPRELPSEDDWYSPEEYDEYGQPIEGPLPDLPPSRDLGKSGAMRMVLPVGRSGWAIAAGYLGLFSILVVPAPFAIIAGIIAIRNIRRNPDLHGIPRAIFGIVCGIAWPIAWYLFKIS